RQAGDRREAIVHPAEQNAGQPLGVRSSARDPLLLSSPVERIADGERCGDGRREHEGEKPGVSLAPVRWVRVTPHSSRNHGLTHCVVLKIGRNPGGARLEPTSKPSRLSRSMESTGALTCLRYASLCMMRTVRSTASFACNAGWSVGAATMVPR